ncbi:LptA/OstA family protein [Paracoccaceae bacterium]|nr:LptA/OstA family protein [Paracoccaceae bacterium]
MNKTLLILTHAFMFLLCFSGSETSSEIKKEIIRFSSETAHVKKKDGLLYLSGDVKISYKGYLIKSDFLKAKTNGVGSQKIKVIEAEKNVYFSNDKDIVAKGDKLFMDIEKKLVSIEGNVEFSQNQSIIRANKINVDLETETVDFEGIKDSLIKQ